MQNEYLISIVIPTLNRLQNLSRIMEALKNQNFDKSKYQILLVNDSQVNHLCGLAKKYSENLNVLLIDHKQNMGRSHAVNSGLMAAKGEIIIVIDDDMMPVSREYLAEHYSFHSTGDIKILVGTWSFPEEYLRRNKFLKYLSSRNRLSLKRFKQKRGVFGYFHTANTSFPRTILKKVGLFSPDFREYGWEDVEWGIRSQNLGIPACILDKVDVLHYYDPDMESYLKKMEGIGRSSWLLYKLQPTKEVESFLRLDFFLSRKRMVVFAFQRFDRIFQRLAKLFKFVDFIYFIICRHLLFVRYLKGVKDGYSG